MLRLRARDLDSQNIGSVITLWDGNQKVDTLIDGVVSDGPAGKVSIYTAVGTFELESDAFVEVSLRHDALSTSQLQRDFYRFAEWFKVAFDEVFPHEEVAA